jgi:hypothetical protein
MSGERIFSTVSIAGQEFTVPTVDGKVQREGKVAQLGKRLICAEELEFVTIKNSTNPDGTEIVETVRRSENVTGTVNDTEGNEIYLGCGTEILVIKPGENSIPLCCDIPMALMQPKVLPSAD